MYGRITSQMVTTTVMENIDSGLSALQRTTEELSSGKKIAEASDNPYGASQVIDLQSQLDGLASYSSNVQEGTAWTSVTNGALSNMQEVTQKVRELVVQASSSGQSQSTLNDLANEVDQLAEQIKQDANSQYAGQYVFSGTATNTAPYQGASDTYKGNEGTIARAIGPSSSVTINSNVASVLGNGKESGDGKLLDVLRTISADMRSGSTEALSNADLTNLDTNMHALTSLQGSAGVVTDQLQMASGRIESLQESVSASLAGVDGVNIAEASVAYSNEQAAYTAALHSGAIIVQESLLNFLK